MAPDFLSFFDLPQHELIQLLRDATEFKRDFTSRSLRQLLKGKRIAAIWDADGFRNRVAFELGARLLGAELVEVPYSFGQREDAADLARYLDNWFDAVVVRTPSHEALRTFAKAARIPVINARTRHNHPCEVLSDLAYVLTQRGSIEGLKVVYVGQSYNICHSWLEAAACLPIRVTHVTPVGFEADAMMVRELQARAVGEIRVVHGLDLALKDADVVYTDTWPTTVDASAIRDAFLPIQVSAALLDQTSPSCIFLPCPPVHRGEEVTADAMESSRCKVYEAKDYLLHAQNALLVHLLA